MAYHPSQLTTYFTTTADSLLPGEAVPNTSAANDVTYFIDGQEYFNAVALEIRNLRASTARHRFFYFSNWWLGLTARAPRVPFRLVDGGPTLLDQLADLTARGVDVRVMTWISAPVNAAVNTMGGSAAAISVAGVITHNVESIAALRARRGLENKTVINTLSHPAGGMHMKCVLAGSNDGVRAYISGLDFVDNRMAPRTHAGGANWHDAGVVVEGPAAARVYEHFRTLWNQQLAEPFRNIYIPAGEGRAGHPTHFAGASNRNQNTPPIDARTWPAAPAAPARRKHVQVLRTSPMMNFNGPPTSTSIRINAALRFVHNSRRAPLPFAPGGLFEFKAALRKAIGAATRYIYIEDQAMTSFDVMDWIRQRMIAVPNLKVVLMHMADPTDEDSRQVLVEALRTHLFGIPRRGGAATLPPARWSNVVFAHRNGIIVHSKVTLIDDVWAAVGSANCMQRSLTTDFELSVGVIDESARDGAGVADSGFVARLRVELWWELCGRPYWTDAALLPIDSALSIFNAAWGTRPPGVSLTRNITFENLPVPPMPFDRGYQLLVDADSREGY